MSEWPERPTTPPVETKNHAEKDIVARVAEFREHKLRRTSEWLHGYSGREIPPRDAYLFFLELDAEWAELTYDIAKIDSKTQERLLPEVGYPLP